MVHNCKMCTSMGKAVCPLYYSACVYLKMLACLTVTKIKQERTKIVSFFDFILHFSINLLEIFSIALQLSYEAMF